MANNVYINNSSTGIVTAAASSTYIGNLSGFNTNGTIYPQNLNIQGTFGYTTNSPDILCIRDISGNEIVKINSEGSISWKQGFEIDAAAEALSTSLRLGIESAVGITKAVKTEMRNTLFEEIIKLAEIKGSLTVNDLTFMFESSKIMEKLKTVGNY